MIPTLLAAGFGHHTALQASVSRASTGTDPNDGKLFQLFKQDHLFTLAGHASHSSHSSHASHASHQSGNGGYSAPSYNPAPVYTPPTYYPPSPPPKPTTRPQSLFSTPSTPSTSSTATDTDDKKLRPLTSRSTLFKTVVMHVQVALLGRGLFDGPIDGVVGPKMRAALRKFQQEQGLLVTGTITPQTLDAMHVPTQ